MLHALGTFRNTALSHIHGDIVQKGNYIQEMAPGPLL